MKIASVESGNGERWLDRLGTCIFTCLVLSGYHWLTKTKVPPEKGHMQDGRLGVIFSQIFGARRVFGAEKIPSRRDLGG